MKSFNRSIICLVLLLTIFNHAYAGAISGGGGDVERPTGTPVTPLEIKKLVENYAGIILVVWFNRQKITFKNEPLEYQDRAIARKIFRSDKDIFDVIKNLNVEVRDSAPCLDKEGAPHDGSIYASKEGAICISSFTMAPKLYRNDYEAQVLGLIIHELSHFFGTTENEADYLQYNAVKSLSHFNFSSVIGDIGYIQSLLSINNPFGKQLLVLRELADHPEMVSEKIMRKQLWWTDHIGHLYNSKSKYNDWITFVPYEIETTYYTQRIRLENILEYLCIKSEWSEPSEKEECLTKQNLIFQSDKEVTASQYYNRVYGGTESRFNDIIFKRVENNEDVSAELNILLNFLNRIYPYVDSLYNFKVKVF